MPDQTEGGVTEYVKDIGAGICYYSYDKLNRMIKVLPVGASAVEYSYNGDGLRVEKIADGKTTRYMYEYDKVVLEFDGKGRQTARNIQGLNPISRTVDGTTMYYLYNGHADVTALIDGAGVVKETYYYDAFGNIAETTGTVNNPFTYAGYQYDKETGLYYLNARMYDPKTARFMQEDSYTGEFNDPLSLNLYTYCHNEPIMYTDPTGHRNVSGADSGGGSYTNKGKSTKDTTSALTDTKLRKEKERQEELKKQQELKRQQELKLQQMQRKQQELKLQQEQIKTTPVQTPAPEMQKSTTTPATTATSKDAGGSEINVVSTTSDSETSTTNTTTPQQQTTPSTPMVTMSSVLYGDSDTNSKLQCGFDGYKTVNGRHEGIDFANGKGKNIYSLTEGTVIRVTEGIDGIGKNHLSQIAIFYPEPPPGKTVVYVHANPANIEDADPNTKGIQVERGDLIGTESNRGTKDVHTHVEIREGKKTSAAKSVDDPVLDNKDPTNYWESKGYIIK